MKRSNRLTCLIDNAREHLSDLLNSENGTTDNFKSLDLLLRSINQCREEAASKEPFGYLIKIEMQDGSVEESFIKAEELKYKYIADACDFGRPIPLYK